MFVLYTIVEENQQILNNFVSVHKIVLFLESIVFRLYFEYLWDI